jgi:anti-sigma factor RsiW
MTKMKKNSMTEAHERCDQSLVDQYYDRDLNREEEARFEEHLETCPVCRQALKENQRLSEAFTSGLADAAARTDLDEIETRVMEKIRARGLPWWRRIPSLLTPKRVLLPATVLATLLVVAVFYNPLSRSPNHGPSALVSSLGGETASVMVFETPETRQTIIWFNEL